MNNFTQYTPIYIPEYFIYDICYTDSNECLIVTPKYTKHDIKLLHINAADDINDSNHNMYFTQFKMIQTNNSFRHGSNDQSLYCCPLNVLSEHINVSLNSSHINILINGKHIYTKINKYPVYENEIIMSTLVLNEDKYIRQWINYHLMFNITRFIIYDNYHKDKNLIALGNKSHNEKTDLQTLLKDFIDSGIVLLIKWDYPYSPCAQQTQQNHSIHTFKKCKYIGLFDIDEYIFTSLHTSDMNLHTIFDNYLTTNKINYDDIGSLRLLSRPTYNIHNNSEDNYDFMKISTCTDFPPTSYEKNFVIPKNVNIFSVHMIIDGKPMINLPTNFMYFFHYIFLNKLNRGRYIPLHLLTTDTNINKYYSLLMTKLQNNKTINQKNNNELIPKNKSNNVVSKNKSNNVLTMIPKGGFGNVLFIYIAGYSIAKKHNMQLMFLNLPQPNRPRMNTYDIFNCTYSNVMPREHIIHEKTFTYSNIVIPANTNVTLDGYYQSYKYSDGYIDEIKQELWQNIPNQLQKIQIYLAKVMNYNNVLKTPTTILIHVRRTDYLTASDFHSNLTDSYYINSINTIIEKINEPKIKLIVFSDDIEFIKTWPVISKYPHHIVELIDPVDTFLLMTMCDHFIIANSSLSLSAYYFRNNKNAQLCIPQRWFEPKAHKYLHSDLVEINEFIHIIDG